MGRRITIISNKENPKEEIQFQLSGANWMYGPCLEMRMEPINCKKISDLEAFLREDKSFVHYDGVTTSFTTSIDKIGKAVFLFHEKIFPLGLIYGFREKFWMAAYPRQVERIFAGKHYGPKEQINKEHVHNFLFGVFSFLKRLKNNNLISAAIIEDEVDIFPGKWPSHFENGILFSNWLPNDGQLKIDQKKSNEDFAFIRFEDCK